MGKLKFKFHNNFKTRNTILTLIAIQLAWEKGLYYDLGVWFFNMHFQLDYHTNEWLEIISK